MGKINIQDVEPGMTLETDLFAPGGQFLLAQGTELSENHLQILKNWQVIEVNIEGTSAEQIQEEALRKIDPEILQKCRDQVEPFFHPANMDSSVMQELYRLVIEHVAERVALGQDPFENWPSLDPNEVPHYDDNFRRTTRFPKTAATLLQKETQLTTLPDVYYRLLQVLNSTDTSAQQIADTISKDSNLAAKVLRLANSAFYDFVSQIDTISRAVTLIGTNEISDLVQGISLTKFFENIPSELINMEAFWKHSVACGIFARLLSKWTPESSQERAFVAGLLHDMGRLIMLKQQPTQYSQAIYISRQEKLPLFEAEKKIFGFDHSEVGGNLCQEWNLPKSLSDTIHNHHTPTSHIKSVQPSIIHLADIITHSLRIASSGNIFVPYLQDVAWDLLGLSPNILRGLIKEADEQIKESLSAFLS